MKISWNSKIKTNLHDINDNLENKLTILGWLNELNAEKYVRNNREKYIISMDLNNLYICNGNHLEVNAQKMKFP